MNTTHLRRTAVAGAAVTAALAGALAAPTTAGAAPAATLNVAYDAVGSTYVAKTNSSIPLGPTTLSTKLAGDGSFTATLPLTPQTTSFKAFGLVPITATVTFIPVGRITGTLEKKGARTVVKTVARYTIKLSDVKALGLPTFAGDSCQTVAPVRIPLATAKTDTFSIFGGGVVSGTFAIGQFANCGLTTGLINLLVPGEGNTATITLSNGHAV